MRFERIKLEDIPKNSDTLTMKSWLGSVAVGGFIDYDGFGYLAVKDKMSHLMVLPSYVENGKITEVCMEFDFDNTIPYENDWKFTHIVWFNK